MSKKVLITGANGGFGSLTVNSLLAKGHQVAAAMRDVSGKNAEAAKIIQAAGAIVVEMDVTNDESVEKGVEEAIEQLGGLDVVVNNAGVGVAGMQEHFTTEDFHHLFEVNVYGVQRVNRAALPYFRGQESGLIIYISSLLGRMVLPFFGPYNASKAALESLAENYRMELSGFGIENAIIEPGAFGTNFFAHLKQPSDQSRNESYEGLSATMQQMNIAFEDSMTNNEQQDPQRVADAVVSLIEAKKGEKPFRTTVDFMGMGEPVKGYNEQLENITKRVYSNFHMEGMLEVK